jgi:hypothetical protein
MGAVRDTSREAYEEIVRTGLLSGMRLEAYKAIYTHGPMTGRELDLYMYGVAGQGRDYHKRLSELAALGVVREVERRPCNVTGKQAYVYDVIPGALPDRDTFKKRITERRQKAMRAAFDEGYQAGASAGYQAGFDAGRRLRQSEDSGDPQLRLA